MTARPRRRPATWIGILAGAAVFAVSSILMIRHGNPRGWGYLAVALLWTAASMYMYRRGRGGRTGPDGEQLR